MFKQENESQEVYLPEASPSRAVVIDYNTFSLNPLGRPSQNEDVKSRSVVIKLIHTDSKLHRDHHQRPFKPPVSLSACASNARA